MVSVSAGRAPPWELLPRYGAAMGQPSDEWPNAERITGNRGGRQVIPRPASAHPGASAPWAGLPPQRREGITIDRVRRCVADRPPRPAAAPPPAGSTSPGAASAVLVAMFEEAGEARVLLTRRAAHLRSHRGEVSFPGGRIDPGESPEAAARREAWEEVGLDPASVELVGRLDMLTTLSSGSLITPVIGFLAGRPVLHVNPDEVEHGFDVALAELAAPETFREERWALAEPGVPPHLAPPHLAPPSGPDGSFPVWFFELPADTVWGATARVLVELLRLVLAV